jgi:hypothetical protein
MFVLPKPDPWVMDMEIIFFFGNVLKSGIRYLIAMETLKYPEIFKKKPKKPPTFFKKKRIRISTFVFLVGHVGANKQFFTSGSNYSPTPLFIYLMYVIYLGCATF